MAIGVTPATDAIDWQTSASDSQLKTALVPPLRPSTAQSANSAPLRQMV